MLVTFPDVSPALVAVTSPVTQLKLIAFAVTLPTLVVAIVVSLAARGPAPGRRPRMP